MKTIKSDFEQEPASQEHRAIHGTHLRTFEALFRHSPPHNLAWMDVVALIGRIGAASKKANGEFSFEVGRLHHLMHNPHTEVLTSSEVVELRHFLQRAGWSPEAPSEATAHPEPPPASSRARAQTSVSTRRRTTFCVRKEPPHVALKRSAFQCSKSGHRLPKKAKPRDLRAPSKEWFYTPNGEPAGH